jgi:uroporphyrinogen decarboxylase
VIWPLAAEAETSASEPSQDVDIWGCRWERLPPNARRVTGHPLASWDRLSDYQFPQHPSPAEVAKAAQLTRDRQQGKCVLAGGISFFQQMQDLRGFESFMFDLAQRPPQLLELRDRMVAHHLEGINLWADYGLIDCVQILDDWGIQTGLVAHPRVWRELFESAYVQLFEAIHRIGACVLFHTCGRTIEIIPGLIAAGVDILMVQFSAHTFEELSAACQGKVCILTDPDRQRLLPFGKPEEIRAYLRQAVRSLGTQDGGIIGYGEIADPDVPLANAEALLEAFGQLG